MAGARGEAEQTTPERLLEAAALEFNAHGYGGTDTNKIARRAGFAPQTFYRWFTDKLVVFIKIYERWQGEELGLIEPLLAENASDARVAEAIIAHHRAYLVFRRSLRQLAVESEAVRIARARSRQNQIAYLKTANLGYGLDDSAIVAILFQMERLADALAEGEFSDIGVDSTGGEAALARLVQDLRAPE